MSRNPLAIAVVMLAFALIGLVGSLLPWVDVGIASRGVLQGEGLVVLGGMAWCVIAALIAVVQRGLSQANGYPATIAALAAFWFTVELLMRFDHGLEGPGKALGLSLSDVLAPGAYMSIAGVVVTLCTAFLGSVSAVPGKAAVRPAESQPVASTPAKSASERLEELKWLHAAGHITDAELEAKRAEILRDL